jgi:hypothetical protein
MTGRPRPHLLDTPTGRLQAVVRGLAGGAALAGIALLAAGIARLAGRDAEAALGNTALFVGMATLGLSAILGGVRPSRWMAYGPSGGDRTRRPAEGRPAPDRGLLRLSMAIAGAVPFALSVVLAAVH